MVEATPDEESPIRNLHSPSSENLNQKIEVKVEEKQKDIEMQVELNSGEIDMTCNEELMDIDEDHDSSTIRT